MASPPNAKIARLLDRFAKSCSSLSIGFGLLVLTGWAFHLQNLKTILRGQVAVKANTGACFILIGLALWLVRKDQAHSARGWSLPARIFAFVVFTVGVLSFLEYWFGLNLGIDQLLFPAGPEDWPGSIRPGLMAPISAVDFSLLSIAIALLGMRGHGPHVLAQGLAAFAAAVSIFGILDFVLDPATSHTHIAPTTALILFLFSFAIIFSQTECGLGRLLSSSTSGAVLARILLPAAIIIPIAIAWLKWKGQMAGLYTDWTGVSLMTVAAVTLLAGFTAWAAFAADRSDQNRRKAEESVHNLAAIVTCSHDAIIGKTLEGIVTSWNPGAEAIYGYAASEIVGRHISIITPPDRRQEFRALMQRVIGGQPVLHHETMRRRKDGQTICVSLSVSPLRDETGKIVGASTISRDVTDAKLAEEKLRRVNRTLRALSECTETLVRAEDEPTILQRVCDALVGGAGYVMAWVGYAEHDDDKTVRPMASAGFEQGYLNAAQICWADVERGRGPTGTCIRTGKTTVCHDMAGDPHFAPWREHALRRGFRSSMSVPLKVGGEVFGALTIYAVETSEFDPDEQRLLEELASNLTYAILTLRAHAANERAQAELRQASHYTRSLIEASLDPLVTISRGGKITDVNQATESVTGIPRSQLIGSDFSTYFTEPDHARRGYEQVFATGAVQGYPLAIRHVSGKVMDVLYNATIYRNAAGEVDGVFAAARDVTDLKHSEQELRLSRERLALAQKAGHAGNFDWDMQNNINLWTPEVEELHGLAPGEFGGKYEDWEALVLPEDLSAAKRGIESSLHTGEFAGEWRIRRRNDGQIRWLIARAKVLFDEAGRPWRMLGINMDVTERKQAEEQVRQLNEELEQRVIERTAQLEAANKELEAFTYSVSHDLRAPLRHISGFSKILTEEFGSGLPPEAQHHLQRIQEGTRRMGQLVDDLLNLARVGRREPTLQVAGLRSIVDDVIHNLKSDVGDRRVEWKIGELPFVECDTALMQQVFQNLLSNALKFTRPRTQAVIEIGQEERAGASVLYIRDNGVGFSMKYADKLFGVFQRLHRAEDFEGTGVGLATVQRIIQKHGGRIWAEAELDKGATFYITLGTSETAETKTKAATAGDRA